MRMRRLMLTDSPGSRSATPTSRSWSTSRSPSRAGSITTLIGPNGAGKSTLLRAIYGLNRYFGGTIDFAGQAIERLPARGAADSVGIGFVPQGRCNFPQMSVRENLELGAYTLRGSAAAAGDRAGDGAVPAAASPSWACWPAI